MKGLVAGTMLIASAGVASANTITGELWHVPEAIANSATIANTPGTTPDVTFQVNTPMNFGATNATVGAWLASGAAFNIVQNTAGTLTSLMDNFTTGAFVDFKGNVTVTSGQTFTVTHDDGLQLKIGSVMVINDPGPTSPTLTTATYGGPSGTFAFDLTYGECCSGPAVLQIDLPFVDTRGVPGPISGSGLPGLLAGCCAMLGLTWRRRRVLQ
jgi:hypothetical protein